MIKRLLLLAVLSSPLLAQVVQSGYVTYVTSAPSGSCSQNNRVRVVMGAGTVYTCQSGTWTQVGGSAGTISAVNGTANQITSDNASPTTTLSIPSTFIAPGTIQATTSVAGTSLRLNGATSGTTTLTPAAIAGTSTNQLAISNVIGVADGAVATPGLSFSAAPNWGFYRSGTDGMVADIAGIPALIYRGGGTGILVASAGAYGFVAGALAGSGGTPTTGISQDAAGVLDVGTGAQGSTVGKVKAAAYMSVGTKFTASGCSNSTTIGGATAGTFTSGTTGVCTVVITMGDTATSPNGWACSVNNQTTANLIRVSASNATTATVTGTTVSGDVINFGCSVGF